MMNPIVLSPSFLVASADNNDDDLPQQCSMHGFHLRCSISYKSYQAAIISNLVKTTQTFSSFHPGPDIPHPRRRRRCPRSRRRHRRRLRPHVRAGPRSSPRTHPRRRRRRRPHVRAHHRSRPHPRRRRRRRRRPYPRAHPRSSPRPRPRTPFLHLLPTSLKEHALD